MYSIISPAQGNAQNSVKWFNIAGSKIFVPLILDALEFLRIWFINLPLISMNSPACRNNLNPMN